MQPKPTCSGQPHRSFLDYIFVLKKTKKEKKKSNSTSKATLEEEQMILIYIIEKIDLVTPEKGSRED